MNTVGPQTYLYVGTDPQVLLEVRFNGINQFVINHNGPSGAVRQYNLPEAGIWSFVWGTNTFYQFTRLTNGAVSAETGSKLRVEMATNAFTWSFSSEWAGAVVSIKATNGQTLGTWGLPAVIGPEGYSLTASIVTNAALLDGAEVFLDGQSVSSLAQQVTNSAITGAWRPGFDVEFDSTYLPGDWRIQRSDGTIALSGSVSTLDDAVNGRFTVTGTNGATLWTRVPSGDGNGGAWVPSPVVFGQNNNVYQYSFVNNPDPDPLDTPDLPSPSPPPSPPPAPADVTSTTNSVTAAPTPGEDVSVDVADIETPSTDDGEEGVLEGVNSAAEKLAGILESAKQMFSNVALTYNELNKVAFGGVGTSCVLQFGDASIDLSGLVPGFLRNAMKLIILLTGVYAFIMALWNTFK